MSQIFGLISFANVLPLKFFIARASWPSYVKAAVRAHAAVPSALNERLRRRQIGAAISSSIASARPCYRNEAVGICAAGAVLSVLCDEAAADAADAQSATSNALARLLGARGRVVIGDLALGEFVARGKMAPVLARSAGRAAAWAGPRPARLRAQEWAQRLRAAAGEGKAHINRYARAREEARWEASGEALSEEGGLRDLCALWAAQTGLPFAFARFSSFSRPPRWLKDFARASKTPSQRGKIAHYRLQKEAAERGLKPAEIKEYLKFIYYEIGRKEQLALDCYLRRVRFDRILRANSLAKTRKNQKT